MRYQRVDPAQLAPEQKSVYDTIVGGPRGAIGTPLAIWLGAPRFAQKAQELGLYCRFDATLSSRIVELIVLIVAHHWQAAYEWEAHQTVARDAGLDNAVIEAIRTGRAPAFVREDEAVAYLFLRELLDGKAVGSAAWEAAHRLFGDAGTVEIVGIAGYYGMIAMTIRAFEVPKLTSAPPPF